ncbi:uncharacterized protein LOC134693893 isoform X1 [Mytilus trossulus]|uniref:uncharacterized protein LOC134693893 isoform X1 n=2 Tax=Mytilus trossulus TaxID=6551 RepID=UPI0030069B1C
MPRNFKTVFLYILFLKNVFCEVEQSMFYRQTCHQTIVNRDIQSYTVRSIGECAYLCMMVDTCAVITYNITNINQGQGQCNLKEDATNAFPYQYVSTTGMCVMKRDDIQHVQGVLTPEVTSTSSNILDTSEAETTLNPVTVIPYSNTSIIGTVEVIQNLCDTYTSNDIIVLTRGGIYVYDEYDDLWTSSGTCMPVQAFEDIFNAYPNLPDITEIEAIHSTNTDRVELYANNYVWSFLFAAGSLQYTDPGYPMTYTQHLKQKTNRPSLNYSITHPLWAIQRGVYGNQERYFYENGKIHLYSISQPYYIQMTVTQKYYNANNINLNPWIKLPPNVADILLIPAQWNNYIVLTSDGQCHEYVINYVVNLNDPAVSINFLGNIVF